jgi:GntR family transcriptional repressor for pyruvate dehydrogenase complex
MGETRSGVQKTTLVDDVTRKLRDWILAGDVQPGEYLPPRKDLATRFGVGLSTIHEAIQALSAVGLLASHPGKGTWVREDALDTVIHPEALKTRLGELNAEQLYEARAVIEVALTELAAKRAGPDDIARIKDALGAMQESVNDDQAFVEADLAFHLAVARAGRNELLEQFYHLSRKLLSEAIRELIKLPNVKQASIPYQRAILSAIEAHDPQAAREAAMKHMAYAGNLLGVTG